MPFHLTIFSHLGSLWCQLWVTGQAQSSVAPPPACLLAEATVKKHSSHQRSKKRAVRCRRRKPRPRRVPRPLHFQRRNDKNTGWHKICRDAISGSRRRQSQMEPRPTGAQLKLVYRLILTTWWLLVAFRTYVCARVNLRLYTCTHERTQACMHTRTHTWSQAKLKQIQQECLLITCLFPLCFPS